MRSHTILGALLILVVFIGMGGKDTHIDANLQSGHMPFGQPNGAGYFGLGLVDSRPSPQSLTPEEKERLTAQLVLEEQRPKAQPVYTMPRSVEATNGALAFANASGHLALTSPDGMATYTLDPSHENVRSIAWSPDEQYIVYTADNPGTGGAVCIYRIHVTMRETNVVTCDFSSMWNPDWSPDGNHIAFYTDSDSDSLWETFVVPASGGIPIQLMPNVVSALTPEWKDNSTILLAVEEPVDVWWVALVNRNEPTSGAPVTTGHSCPDLNGCTCSTDSVVITEPTLSPGGATISMLRGDVYGDKQSCTAAYYLSLVDISGTLPAAPYDLAEVANTSAGGYAVAGPLRWSPTNDYVGMVAGNSADTQWFKQVDTTQDNVVHVVQAIDAPNWAGWDWSPDGSLIAGSILTTDWELHTGDPIADEFTLLRTGSWPDWSEQSLEAAVDLEATSIEVTQAIQDNPPEHDIPLIEGKETFVRVYARSSPQDVNAVTAWLIVSKDGETLTLRHPTSQTITVRQDGGQRAEVNHTFNFRLPVANWSEGTISLRAVVAPDQQFYEVDYDNNHFPRPSDLPLELTFDRVEPVNIYYQKFEFVEPDGVRHIISDHDIETYSDYIHRVYPVAESGLTWIERQKIEVNTEDFNLGSCNENITSCPGWTYLLTQIPCSATFNSNERCFGWLPTDEEPTANPVFGWAVAPRAISFPGRGGQGDGNGSLIAHELGHTFGLGHPGGEGCQTIDHYGFTDEGDNQLRVFRSGVAFDFMEPNTACGMLRDTQWARWSSYERLMIHFEETPLAHVSQSDTALDIAGIVDGDHNVTIMLLQPVKDISAGVPDAGDGPYFVRLLDGSGGLLFERAFRGGGEAEVGISFYERVPWFDGVETVEIRRDDQLLTSVARTAHAPLVNWNSDLAGLTLDGPTEVSWQATDDDGDRLTFQVAFSPDGGATWQALGQNLEGTSYELDPTFLAGTTEGKLRIIATDGLNSVEQLTDGSFTIPHKAPQVRLLAPDDGATFGLGQVVNLRGSAYDQEDGVLAGANLVWGLDGMPIGAGTTASILELPARSHTVSLTATDSDGASTTASITIIGGQDYEHEKLYLPFVGKPR